VTEYSEYLSSIEEIIEDARNGRMFVLVDDENRENEGDLVIPAQMATPDAINFMAKHGRGLICLSLTRRRCEELDLQLLPAQNQSRLSTAFTLSIEARQGVTTGISAADRAHSISVAIDPSSTKGDLATPGHVFPLMAREGGVLVRAGHTEAAVDISKLAGLSAAGVICEIMNDDGSMARMPDLIGFAQRHNLKIAKIADLIAYRRRIEKLVNMIVEMPFKSQYGGDWDLKIYENSISGEHHVALVKGQLDSRGPSMVRMHQSNVLSDLFWDAQNSRTGLLQTSMEMISDYGKGALVVIRDTDLTDRLKAQLKNGESMTKLMDYGVGAQILVDIGIREMILLSNSARTVIGLEGYGLNITETRPITRNVTDNS